MSELLSLEERVNLIASIGDCDSDQSIIKLDELSALLASNKPEIIAYDGFEPSGRMHIAQGLMKTLSVNKLTRCGVTVVFWVADWFALLNNKLDGDLAKIKICGEYLIEVWKACGMDMKNVRFLWSSDEINKRSDEYWFGVMDIARKFTVSRTKRCGQIMGRVDAKDAKLAARKKLLEEMAASRETDAQLSMDDFVEKYMQMEIKEEDPSDALPNAQLLYPMMQCNDVFFLKADICQLGMDQIKVNVLAREYAEKTKRKFAPVVISHHMLMGLKEGQAKMSKSDPMSAIFMEDSADDVRSKIKKSFCAPGDVTTNPILDYCQHIIFPAKQGPRVKREYEGSVEFKIERSADNGGDLIYRSFEELKEDFSTEKLHPGDLKKAVAKELNELLEPIREHFKNDDRAKKLFAQVKKFKTTK
jgi:tyrosyl-tRNA synthetase